MQVTIENDLESNNTGTHSNEIITDTFEHTNEHSSDHANNQQCCHTCTLSWQGLKKSITESRFILNTIWNHSEYKPFQSEMRSLFIKRVISLIMIVFIDVAISFPMQWTFSALSQTRTRVQSQNSSHSESDEPSNITLVMPFATALAVYCVLSIIAAPLHGMDSYLEKMLYVKLRLVASKCMLHDYHSNHAFYYLSTDNDNNKKKSDKLKNVEKLDNPGQRIINDIDYWAWGLVIIMSVSLINLLTITGAVIVLLYIGQYKILYGFIGLSLISVIFLIIYGGAIMQSLTLIFKQRASFIAGIVRTWDNAEAISWYRAQKFEEKWSFQRFLSMVHTYFDFVKFLAVLESVSNAVQNVGIVLPLILLSTDFFSGKIELGIITQSSYMCQLLIMSLARTIGQMYKLGSIEAGGSRVSELIRGIDKTVKKMTQPPVIHKKALSARNSMYSVKHGQTSGDSVSAFKTAQTVTNTVTLGVSSSSIDSEIFTGVKFETIKQENDVDYLKVENLSVILPNSDTLLLSKLSLTVKKHESLLIVGPSGAGKSSLLRVFSTLWKFGHGTVRTTENSMFLPQKPYLPVLPGNENTLENQLLFPHFHKNKSMQHELSFEQLLNILTSLNLAYVLDYQPNGAVYGSADWSKLLSLGEQQRLAIGRAILKNPKLLFLDEATSALDGKNQDEMYQLLIDHGITFVSVGHRPNLHQFHQNILIFKGDGDWEYMTQKEYAQRLSNQNEEVTGGAGKTTADVQVVIDAETSEPSETCEIVEENDVK